MHEITTLISFLDFILVSFLLFVQRIFILVFILIFSYDSRDKSLKEASHWSDDKTVGGRVSFELGSKLYPARLTLQAVKDSDGGLYRCRVDFKKSPTRNHNVNLTVLRK